MFHTLRQSSMEILIDCLLARSRIFRILNSFGLPRQPEGRINYSTSHHFFLICNYFVVSRSSFSRKIDNLLKMLLRLNSSQFKAQHNDAFLTLVTELTPQTNSLYVSSPCLWNQKKQPEKTNKKVR